MRFVIRNVWEGGRVLSLQIDVGELESDRIWAKIGYRAADNASMRPGRPEGTNNKIE